MYPKISSIYEFLYRNPKGKRSSISNSPTVYQTAFAENQLMKNSINYLSIIHNTQGVFIGGCSTYYFLPQKSKGTIPLWNN